MYFLINKNTVVAAFEKQPAAEFSDEVLFREVERIGKLPFGFEDINAWLNSRKSSKHNAHLRKLMREMGCDDNEGFIRATHAATINDTFWIKSDLENLTWEQISLYRNPFTDTISRLAFEGVGLYAGDFSSTSPELSCEGSFRKCFRKEKQRGSFGSDIFIYKRGNDLGPGLEPYCEMLASEIAAVISPDNYVPYRTVLLHEKLASKCNLFTNEQHGYASFSKLMKARSLQDVFDFFDRIGASQAFREMLVVDSLCFNQDRHAGNYGVLFDNDTLEITGIAPIFDLNLSMLPYVSMKDFDNIGDKLFEYAPVLGDDFTRIGQMAMNDALRDRVKTICDFSFAFRGDDVFTPERVKAMEGIIRRQAQALLSSETLRTKDVFFSQNAADDEQYQGEVRAAVKRFHIFADAVDQMECEKCGHELVSISESQPCGMTCPNCGWGWAATYIEPINLDESDYHVILVSSDNSLNSIKTVSEVANCNYIEAKRLINHSPVDVFHGQAVEVKAIKEKLEAVSIDFKIEPEFPY